MRSIKLIFTVSVIIAGFGNAIGFPGDHKSYTCPFFRSTDCNVNPTVPEEVASPSVAPGYAINQSCANAYQAGVVSQFAMFGDSLTDYVDKPEYGAASFETYLYAAGYGIYNNIQNYGKEKDTTNALVARITGGYKVLDGTTSLPFPVPYDGTINMCRPDKPGVVIADRKASASRSVVMIGGNDSVNSGPMSIVFPSARKHLLNYSINNIRKFIDWNIENGKSVLLLGTIPISSDGIVNYDTSIIDRTTLCQGIEPSRDYMVVASVLSGTA